MTLRAWMILLGLLMVAPAARAQQATVATSEDQPTLIGQMRQWAHDTHVIERIDGTLDGWYPRLGGIHRGSGFGGGPGYRFHVGDVLVDLSGAISVRNYQRLDTQVRWLRSRDGRAALWTDYEHDRFTQEPFFGIGTSTPELARTDYALNNDDVSVRGVFTPRPHVELAAHVGYMHPRVSAGTDPEYASTAQRFTDAQAAGLAAQPAFVHAGVSADIDTRNASGRPTQGGIYHAAFGRWSDRAFGNYDFTRLDVNATQFIALTANRRHVIAARAGVAAATADTGARVPFYFLPYVGGADTIRSYIEYRFKAENALWYGAEYRWTFMPYATLTTFVDAGRAAHRLSRLSDTPTKAGYGIGLVAHTDKATLGRLEFAVGDEGWQWWFDFGVF